jgi:hypothetical protein
LRASFQSVGCAGCERDRAALSCNRLSPIFRVCFKSIAVNHADASGGLGASYVAKWRPTGAELDGASNNKRNEVLNCGIVAPGSGGVLEKEIGNTGVNIFQFVPGRAGSWGRWESKGVAQNTAARFSVGIASSFARGKSSGHKTFRARTAEFEFQSSGTAPSGGKRRASKPAADIRS